MQGCLPVLPNDVLHVLVVLAPHCDTAGAGLIREPIDVRLVSVPLNDGHSADYDRAAVHNAFAFKAPQGADDRLLDLLGRLAAVNMPCQSEAAPSGDGVLQGV